MIIRLVYLKYKILENI